jgi:protein associated with RNAse G/E
LKTTKIKSLLAVTLLIAGVVGLIFYAVNSILDDIYLKKNFAYTISDQISIGTSSRVGTDNRYTFFLKGEWYVGSTTLPLRRDGTKYFIKFYPKDPNRNQATKIIANSEDVKNLPPEGYKNLPHQ